MVCPPPAEPGTDADSVAAQALRSTLVSGTISAYDLAQGPHAAEIRRELESTLASAGVSRIQLSVGDPFDVNLHAAVSTEPTTDQAHIRCVAREVRSGWLWGGRVLRAVDVVVWTG